MSSLTGRKAIVIAVLVALLIGAIGFGGGYLVRASLDNRPGVVAEITAAPSPTVPAAPVDTRVPPTPVPTQAPTAPVVSPSPTPASSLAGKSDLFWEAWNLILRDYYGEIPSDEKVLEGAIQGAMTTLDDPFTGYINPESATMMRQELAGSYGGIGAYVGMEDGNLVIVEPMKGQPAEKAGLQEDDIVLEVDGTEIVNMTVDEARWLIRGEPGTTVRLKIARSGVEPFEVDVVRALISIPLLDSKMLSDGIAYAQLNEFSSGASAKLGEAIKGLLDQKPKGLILDLRGNPGGFLNEGVLVAGLFLPKDSLVTIERSKEGQDVRYTSPDEPVAPDIPMVVLVNGASASAAEIVAGALQDYGRAPLIGEKTFGKGSVQWAEPLSDGGELRVTVARWFTPKDRAIHGVGLEPDILVELTAEDAKADKDPQLDRAVEYTLTGK